MSRTLLLSVALVLAGCTSTISVPQNVLVRCPATAPDLDCEYKGREWWTPEALEQSMSCWRLESITWHEAWADCPDE